MLFFTDVAVTVGHQVEFFAENGSLTGQTVIPNDDSTLVGIAYDDETFTMFLSGEKESDYSIFSIDLSTKNVTAKPLLKS